MNKLQSNDVVLELNTGTSISPVWKAVLCISQNGLNGSDTEINGESKCGADYAPGIIKWQAPIRGFYEKTPNGLTELSGQELINLYQAQQYHTWRMRNTDFTYYRQFEAYLSGYTENTDLNTFAVFNGNLNIRGSVITTYTS